MGDDHVTKEFCALQHKQVSEDVTAMRTMVQEMHNALFVGNGSPAKVLLLDRHDRILSVLIWAVGLLFTSVVGAVAARLFGAI